MRKAAIDIGTNSTRLLIADCLPDKIIEVYNSLETTRIGEGIGKACSIKENSLQRTIDCLNHFLQKCREKEVEHVRVIATSAVRDSLNRQEVVKKITARTGIKLEVLSGEKEAYLSYLGAISDMPSEKKCAVLDIGGGSTEFVYPVNNALHFSSVKLGAVRLAEQPEILEDCEIILKNLYDKTLPKNYELLAVGGTVTTLVAIKMELEKYLPSVVHGQKLNYQEIIDIKEMLTHFTLEERMKVKGLQPQRADIIIYGIEILEKLLTILNKKEIIVSEKDILYGTLLEKN